MRSCKSSFAYARRTITDLFSSINAIDGGQNYVDFLPWVRFIPFIPYKALASSYFKLAENTYKSLMDEARQNMEAGRPSKGLASQFLEKEDDAGTSYREKYWALGAFYLAGSDTQSIMSRSLM
jgi:hypothetical protein